VRPCSVPHLDRRFVWAGLLPPACLAAALLPGPAAAQGVGFDVRLGAGASYGDAIGFTALVAPELTVSHLRFRAEARTVVNGSENGSDATSRVVVWDAAVGFAARRSSAKLQVYGLGTVGQGWDIREADELTTVGAVLGVERGGHPGLFGELRYEAWIQEGARDFDLPSGALSLLAGLRVP